MTRTMEPSFLTIYIPIIARTQWRKPVFVKAYRVCEVILSISKTNDIQKFRKRNGTKMYKMNS